MLCCKCLTESPRKEARREDRRESRSDHPNQLLANLAELSNQRFAKTGRLGSSLKIMSQSQGQGQAVLIIGTQGAPCTARFQSHYGAFLWTALALVGVSHFLSLLLPAPARSSCAWSPFSEIYLPYRPWEQLIKYTGQQTWTTFHQQSRVWALQWSIQAAPWPPCPLYSPSGTSASIPVFQLHWITHWQLHAEAALYLWTCLCWYFAFKPPLPHPLPVHWGNTCFSVIPIVTPFQEFLLTSSKWYMHSPMHYSVIAFVCVCVCVSQGRHFVLFTSFHNI